MELNLDLQDGNASTNRELPRKPVTPITSENGPIVNDRELATRLDQFAIEDVVEFKISRFLDQIGTYYPENVHELIMTKIEKPLLSQILRRVGGNQVHASKILGINRNTLRKKMKIYGL
jgi:DNA-binding protein Fis